MKDKSQTILSFKWKSDAPLNIDYLFKLYLHAQDIKIHDVILMQWPSPDDFDNLTRLKQLEFKYEDKESIYDELEKNWS